MQSPPKPLAEPRDPGIGEVRVRLCWLSMSASEWQAAPLIGIVDGAGVIDAIGSGVDGQALGMPVWLWNTNGSSHLSAPYITTLAEHALPLPDGMALDAGACLGTTALAAMHAVLADGGVAGKRVLIAGGVSAVGHYAIQFARLAGAAQVIAAVRSAVDSGIALDAGAHATVVEGEAELIARVRQLSLGEGVDRVIECDSVPDLARDLDLVRSAGEVVIVYTGDRVEVTLPLQRASHANARLRFIDVRALGWPEQRSAICELQAWLERGLICHRIGARLTRDQLGAARELARSGIASGQVLLAMA